MLGKGRDEFGSAAMSVLLFYAAVILAGGMVATAVVAAPLAVLRWAIGGSIPGWLLVGLAYLLSVGAIKLFNRGLPGLLFLTVFMFLVTTAFHLGQAWRLLDFAGRAVLIALATGLLLFLFAGIRRSGALWPLALITRIAAMLA